MDFLYEYGLFLAKAITFVVALAVVVGLIASAGIKQKSSDKGQVSVEPLNDYFEALKDTLLDSILTDKEFKAMEKQEKKQAKQAQKDEKNKVDTPRRKRVYVMEFDGDVKASAVDELREMITAVLTVAEPSDEVVVKLESGGGMVHSYGLASSQLARITQKQIPLTVCVDKVAASGGYMMACVANKILAAPFAVVGSIGVVAQLPNFNKVLKKYDIDYEMLTAGKYKRTLTMLGENTEEGRQKFIEDLEDTHVLFKEFIVEHRAQVDIETVATGEIWFGSRALANNLVDGISTSDEYLFGLSQDADLYELSITHKKSLTEKLGVAVAAGVEQSLTRVWTKLQQRYFA